MSEEQEMSLHSQEGDGASEQKLHAALRAAMRPEMPSRGFAERIEARVARLETPSENRDVLAFRKTAPAGPLTRGVTDPASVRVRLAKAAVLLLAITVPLGLRLHHQTEMARGEAAKEQVLLAFRITGTQLRSIQERTQAIHAGGAPGRVSQ